MVKKADRNKAIDFLVARLEQNSNQKVLKTIISPNTNPNPTLILGNIVVSDQNAETTNVVLFDKAVPEQDYDHMLNNIFTSGMKFTPVFYKDGNTFGVPLLRHQTWRLEKSLKNYTKHQIKDMLALRKLERKVLEPYHNEVVYLIPGSNYTPETLEKRMLLPVNLDYSHLDTDFAKDGESKTYKIPYLTNKTQNGPVTVTAPQRGIYSRLDF